MRVRLIPRSTLLAALLLLLCGTGVAAQASEVAEVAGPFADGPLRVWLVTADRGDQVYEMFGHNALLVEDDRTGQALVWNWGLFNFDDVDFIPRFLRGTMRYTMGPAELEPFLRQYMLADRAVYANRIHLTQAEAAELDAFVRWNFQPENRAYIYDYFRDNCSTRIRDLLDLVLGGRLEAHFAPETTGRSYRWFSRRQVQVTGWVDQGLSFLLGMRGERPITAWEAMFLPVELMERLEAFSLVDAGGTSYPLLGPREVWVPSTRGPLPPTPPGPAWSVLLAGVLLGGLLGGAARQVARVRQASAGAAGSAVAAGAGAHQGDREATGEATRQSAREATRKAARQATEGPGAPRFPLAGWGVAIPALAWGAGAGALGLLLVAAWFTDHHFIQANLNLFHTSPLAPVVGVLLARLALSPRPGPGWRRATLGVTFAMVGLSAAVVLLQAAGALLPATGLPRQGNLDVLFLAVPLHAGLAFAAWQLARPSGSSSPHPTLPS